MAGEGSRFNYEFKPFLFLDNRRFIEHVLDSFASLDVETYNFIVTEEQEKNFNVLETLRSELFHDKVEKIRVITIKRKTSGPFETVSCALEETGPMANIVVCDCDHSVDTHPLVQKLSQKN